MADWSKCKLDPMILLALAMRDEDPCSGCNHDRTECHGAPYKEK